VELLAAMGDPIRLQILDLLSDSPVCVCEIQGHVDVAPNLLSYHLKVLREAGLVESERRGRWVDYRLTNAATERVVGAIPEQLRPGERA
jgi:ArsR family transcriptional regulator, arsenate/arsenite/antimonite-responsive transcriptional repressor